MGILMLLTLLLLAADPAPVALEGHKDTITCLSYSRDGKLLASGKTLAADGVDRKVTLWSVARILQAK
jgi:WD40 repeat protein